MGDVFKNSLQAEELSVTWELVPGRGAVEKGQEELVRSAEAAAKCGKIHALTITDNPGGNPAISAEFLGVEVSRLGIEPLVHFTCKDKSRNEMENLLYGLERAGVTNLLIMTGDYPVSGYKGRSRPVFDIDPIHLLEMITDLNNGLEFPGMKPGSTVKLQPAHFFAGAAVSPFKKLESEQMVQYYKLKKKIDAGAQFIVTQLGYDARKIHEVIQIKKKYGFDIPFIGNIYILPFGAANVMSKNMIPGCVVTKKLVETIDGERKADDKGKGARLLRGAQMYAFMKGMGFDGVHIGGHGMKVDDAIYIIEKGEELYPNWQDEVAKFDFPQKGGFYYFKKDEKTGLNTDEESPRTARPEVPLKYKFSRLMHNVCFEPKGALFGLMRGISKSADKGGFFRFMEHMSKVALFECMDCGDCALTDVAYVCPMSQCPKNQRNGACGGSFEGWCEVYPNEKKCVWVQAYDRLKNYNEEGKIEGNVVPPPNWDFFHTSSWANYFLGRDHSAKKAGIQPPDECKKG